MKKIGFIGLGIMGAAMAGHLMDVGYELSVYNRTKSKADELVARGAKYCDSPGACARGQDIVITIVGYPKDVEEVYLGTDGILANLKEGAYTADMTTSSPALAERIYAEAKKRGIHALDAQDANPNPNDNQHADDETPEPMPRIHHRVCRKRSVVDHDARPANELHDVECGKEQPAARPEHHFDRLHRAAARACADQTREEKQRTADDMPDDDSDAAVAKAERCKECTR